MTFCLTWRIFAGGWTYNVFTGHVESAGCLCAILHLCCNAHKEKQLPSAERRRKVVADKGYILSEHFAPVFRDTLIHIRHHLDARKHLQKHGDAEWEKCIWHSGIMQTHICFSMHKHTSPRLFTNTGTLWHKPIEILARTHKLVHTQNAKQRCFWRC